MPNPREQEPHQPTWRLILARYEQAWERYSQASTLHNFNVLKAGEAMLVAELLKPGKFPLGQMVATPGAIDAMAASQHIAPEFLLRHKHGDWGKLGEEDKAENAFSLLHGLRVLSAYDTRLSERLWVITEADRSVTTILLPEDY